MSKKKNKKQNRNIQVNNDNEIKMSKKKIGLIILLVLIIVAVIVIIVNSNEKQEQKIATTNTVSDVTHQTTESQNEIDTKTIKVSQLSDGTLYSTTDEEIQADIVVGDNYFDTQMADMNLNFSNYEGKTIEIEGMYISNLPYTFVGRYSTSNICPSCPTGYSYFEYEFDSDELPTLKDEEDWIKVIGTLRSAYDPSISSDYYYIEVSSLEVMNERGLDTVSN